MEALKVIAESGGTKTDWLIIENNQVKDQFTTDSLHPRNITSERIEALNSMLKDRFKLEEVPLSFYGAGCYSEVGKEKLKKALVEIGFKNFDVHSDLDAAHLACWGRSKGWTVILGTGSALIYHDGASVLELVGGKGVEVGDEGSGAYFGKLLLERYKKGNISIELKQKLSDFFNPIESQNGKIDATFLATSAEYLNNVRSSEIEQIHRENIQAFCRMHLRANINKVKVVGSYGFFYQDLVKNIMEENGIKVLEFIHKPIKHLTEY